MGIIPSYCWTNDSFAHYNIYTKSVWDPLKQKRDEGGRSKGKRLKNIVFKIFERIALLFSNRICAPTPSAHVSVCIMKFMLMSYFSRQLSLANNCRANINYEFQYLNSWIRWLHLLVPVNTFSLKRHSLFFIIFQKSSVSRCAFFINT